MLEETAAGFLKDHGYGVGKLYAWWLSPAGWIR